ncbi:hypothetical protein Tco_0596873 [Tanacetum coccineum]
MRRREMVRGVCGIRGGCCGERRREEYERGDREKGMIDGERGGERVMTEGEESERRRVRGGFEIAWGREMR